MSVRNLLGSTFINYNINEKLIFFGNFKNKEKLNIINKQTQKKISIKTFKYSLLIKVHRFIFFILTSLETNYKINKFENKNFTTLKLIKKKLNKNFSNYILNYYKFSFSKIASFLTFNNYLLISIKFLLKFALALMSFKYIIICLYYKPRKIFFTHIHASQDKGLLIAAKILNIETIGLVHSWDNPTSKTLIPFKFDKILCWNKIIQDEMISIYNYDINRVFIVGIPQFDIYNKYKLGGKKDFVDLKLFKIKKKYNVIFFCPSPAFVPMQTKLIEEIVKICKDRQDVNLVIRTHPGQSINLDNLKNIDSVFIDCPSNLYFADIAKIDLAAEFNDVYFINILMNSDLTINCFSTTSIDSLYFDIPNISINYDENEEYFNSISFYHDWKHYKDLLSFNSISLANSNKKLKILIDKYLDNKKFLRDERLDTINSYSPRNKGDSGLKIAEEVFS